MMDQEVRYWFDQAVALPPEERAAFLEASCAGPTVRGEVASLLDYDCGDSDSEQPLRLPTVVRDSLEEVVAEVQADFAPARRVGPFELGRLLGSGGMGLVYEGHRVDGEVRQRVAIKFAQVSASASYSVREGVHRRFHRERQILAQLRHPYIAGLIDAGTTPEGVPYAVIERVDGVPVDEYCDRELLERDDRIRLILKLCEAVQFAHGQLVVHADIKPDNVLVTAYGHPKLIDFGVASELSDDATLTTMRAFTPGYSSPEQCRGLANAVATDVYGIGAVLYRLVTGAKPREVKTAPLEEVLRFISEEDVIPPSRVQPDLEGDLENILLKALHREPQRRYGSVAELADDLQRFLACRPVRATRDSKLYRLRRFARRQWAPLTAAALLMAGLAVATMLSLRQREQAVRRASDTRRMAQALLFDVHDEIAGMVGGAKARAMLGAIAVQYLESLEREYATDPELAWELLNAYARLAQSRGGAASSLGDTNGGLVLAEKALKLGAQVESTATDPSRADRLFAIYEGLIGVFEEAGRDAERREAIDRLVRLGNRLTPLRQVQARRQLARYWDAHGRPADAVQAFEEVIGILRPLCERQPHPASVEAEFVGALAALGRAQTSAGNLTDAAGTLEEAIRWAQSVAAREPQSNRNRRQLYWSHLLLGDVLGLPLRFNLGRPKEALEQYEKARRIAEELAHADPGNDMARVDLVRVIGRASSTMAAIDPEQALLLVYRSEDIARKTSASNQAAQDYRLANLTASVTPLVELGKLQQAQANLAEARRVLARLRQAGADVSEKIVLKAEAILLHAAGRSKDALAVASKHLEMMPAKPGPALGEYYEALEVLERMRVYASGVDPATCETVAVRLEAIRADVRAHYPRTFHQWLAATRPKEITSSCRLVATR
ncbi:MAG: protein kinase [Bryobacterales bacterium]|nr:protein kinase [Bryobacterales bacterium]